MVNVPRPTAEYEVVGSLGRPRTAEPLTFELPATGHREYSAALGDGPPRPVQLLAADPGRGVAIMDLDGVPRQTMRLFADAAAPDAGKAIAARPVVEADGVVRLDTGAFELELCRGTARGTTDSKWGIRHFMDSVQGVDLIPGGDNAIGGVYAPFFTPRTG
ncbi:hypothetical protein [Micromonospora sp. NPDC005413]|uniref:hypothetical protein n=1 Tax=Micromonospora sp. NPDC005413 TaxID=3154563 RepID=UPI0033BB181B